MVFHSRKSNIPLGSSSLSRCRHIRASRTAVFTLRSLGDGEGGVGGGYLHYFGIGGFLRKPRGGEALGLPKP